MTKQNTEQLPAGIYQHYKGNEYTVFAVAHFCHRDDTGKPELIRFAVAIRAGTEHLPIEEHVYLTVYKQPTGELVFYEPDLEPAYDHGVVVYKPNYGDRFYTFRPYDEFTEEVQPGLRRFAFLRSAHE